MYQLGIDPHPDDDSRHLKAAGSKACYPFGGEASAWNDIHKRERDIFAIGSDGVLSIESSDAQLAGLYGHDLFLGATLQMGLSRQLFHSRSCRLSGFRRAP